LEIDKLNYDCIERLTRQVATTRNYARLWDRYLEAIAARPDFHEMGHEVDDRGLEATVRRTATRILRQKSEPIRLVGFKVREIPEAGLLHGVCFFDGHLCLILADTRSRQALIALRSLSEDRCRYGRFSLAAKAWGAAA
jgi:hypothetical protein